MALNNFDWIVERAGEVQKPLRVVVAGADAENILLGVFQAQKSGFASPVLVGEPEKVEPMLERLDLGYHFKVRHPICGSVLTETLLIAETD